MIYLYFRIYFLIYCLYILYHLYNCYILFVYNNSIQIIYLWLFQSQEFPLCHIGNSLSCNIKQTFDTEVICSQKQRCCTLKIYFF